MLHRIKKVFKSRRASNLPGAHCQDCYKAETECGQQSQNLLVEAVNPPSIA